MRTINNHRLKKRKYKLPMEMGIGFNLGKLAAQVRPDADPKAINPFIRSYTTQYAGFMHGFNVEIRKERP